MLPEELLVALDPGHDINTRGKETPRIPRLDMIVKENTFNEAVVNILTEELKRCKIKTLNVAPEMGTDTPLKTRTDRANNAKANLYLSVHANAYDGKWETDAQGVSVHVFPGYPKTKAKGQIVLKWLLKGTPQLSRGVVESDFHVLRETHMDSILVECLFMDSRDEVRLMLSPGFHKEVAQELAQAICEIYGLKYISEAAAHRAEVAEISKYLTASNAALKTLQGNYATLEGTLKTTITETDNVINSLTESLSQQGAIVTSQQQTIESLGYDKSNLQLRVTELEKELAEIQIPPTPVITIDWRDATPGEMLVKAIRLWLGIEEKKDG